VIFIIHRNKSRGGKAKQEMSESADNRPVVTQIEPAPKFWRAEEYTSAFGKSVQIALRI